MLVKRVESQPVHTQTVPSMPQSPRPQAGSQLKLSSQQFWAALMPAKAPRMMAVSLIVVGTRREGQKRVVDESSVMGGWVFQAAP